MNGPPRVDLSQTAPEPYPDLPADRTRWILRHRPDLSQARAALPIDRASHWIQESEPDASGVLRPGLTVFLTNRECPWRCLMCDLWKHTVETEMPSGAIPNQISHALNSAQTLQPLHWIKLYNAGSFFDPRAFPRADRPVIAQQCRGFRRIIVENHPRLPSNECVQFRDEAQTELEVAMGLETAHPETLARLNKGMTREDFARAANSLRSQGIFLRAFLLIQPPFLLGDDALEWACRSMEFVWDHGVETVSLIPTRFGNGALERLSALGQFRPPSIETVSAAFEYGLRCRRGRVFLDLWDLPKLIPDPIAERHWRKRFEQMNRTQCAE